MNVLFITLADLRSVESHDIYSDLIREFARDGHTIYIVSPVERRNAGKTEILKNDRTDYLKNVRFLKVKTGNIQKTNFIEKGISTLLLEFQLKKGIKDHLKNIRFDLVLYSTPPVTIVNPVKYIKKRDNAKTYLMLKDITPQAIVDLGAMKTTGVMGLIYKYFREKEKALYSVSDKIGCMSQANVDFVLKYNQDVSPEKVEICPNSIEIIDKSVTEEERIDIRKKYDIPVEKRVFVYGGNLGRPQGVPFIIDCLKSQANNKEDFFLIVGDGTEFNQLEKAISEMKQNNVRLMKRLPKEDYDMMVGACDIGMIFLDHRFTVPNFPSRLLSYMQAKIPVLACTDKASDVGVTITEGGFGWWCESTDVVEFDKIVKCIDMCNITDFGANGFSYLTKNFSVTNSYQIIIDSISEKSK